MCFDYLGAITIKNNLLGIIPRTRQISYRLHIVYITFYGRVHCSPGSLAFNRCSGLRGPGNWLTGSKVVLQTPRLQRGRKVVVDRRVRKQTLMLPSRINSSRCIFGPTMARRETRIQMIRSTKIC